MRTIRRSYFGVFAVVVAMALMFTLPSMASAAPANDNFADAEAISGVSASVNGTNVGATLENGEPIPNSFGTSSSVWYKWTAHERGEVTLDTCNSDFDTVLSVHTGSTLDSLTRLAFDDDGCGEFAGSSLSFNGMAGTTYYIQVSGYCCDNNQGSFTLNLQQIVPPQPPNDNFASAQTISGESVRVTGTTAGATREVGEPDHYTSNPTDADLWEGNSSVWYRWTAPFSGRTAIDTCTANIDSILAVYTGGELAQLSRVADNNNGLCGGGGGSKVVVEVTEGTTYQIAVSDAGGVGWNTFALTIRNIDSDAGDSTRVSVTSSGAQVASPSGLTNLSISADGRYVAFDSISNNLVPGDANTGRDVFVHDRQTGTTERVSTDGSSAFPSISADGRYVAFNSTGSFFASRQHIFVRDRQTRTLELVSVSSSETQANDSSGSLSMSADGRYVAFSSAATNLVAGDTNNTSDVFVRDRQAGTTERVSETSSKTQANGSSEFSSLSANGRYVAFASTASNLVPGDTNTVFDVFVHDRQTGTTELVSVSSSGTQAATGSGHSISADGRFVAFQSSASNLVENDTNDASDVFVRDRQTGTTERVSVDGCGTQANRGGNSPVSFFATSISADGHQVAFRSAATNLVENDTNGFTDVFVHDRQTGTTELASVSSSRTQANNTSELPTISADGLHVAFRSNASNLVANDTNGTTDVFVHERQAAAQPDDCIAPTTTHTLSPSPSAADWNNSDVSVRLDATDTGGSGAKEIRYSATGADAISQQTVAAANLPATFTVDAEGITTISYSAIDNAGNQESPKTLTVKIDKTAPSVSSTDPPNNTTGVEAAANISATFSESGSGIDLESISTDTFKVVQLKPTGNVPVSSGTFSLHEDSQGFQTVTFDPESSLAKGAYRVTITAGVKDKAGNALAEAYTWQFATAGPSKR